MRRLTGRTALVTGPDRRAARAVAVGLAAEGALVAVHGPDAEAVVAAVREAGGRAFAVPAETPVGGLLAGLGHERLDLLMLAGPAPEVLAEVGYLLAGGLVVDVADPAEAVARVIAAGLARRRRMMSSATRRLASSPSQAPVPAMSWIMAVWSPW